ncbi:MAG TPA: glycosyltransferase family 39 protein [Bryobacteraceae bacterium]|nr:glycosyltransferase family 39 protein [Bryobacteraceae bacterium]
MKKGSGRLAILVFFFVVIVLLAFHGNRVVATNDEGMILEPAQRMLSGARPYVDFFGYMSPGSYWLQAIVFRLFGISLWAGRLIVILDFSAQCALVFWLVARLASLRLAAVTALIFAGFQIADPTFLTAQHRWDSATLALAGLCVLIHSSEGSPGTCPPLLISGALMGFAAWCTPALALVGGAAGIWLLIDSSRRKQLISWTSGVLAVSMAAVICLAMNGCLLAFLKQMTWLKTNYSSVNIMPYGAIVGGYQALFAGASGFELAIRGILVSCLALPAILPIAGVIFAAIAMWRGKIPAEDRPVWALLSFASIAFTLTVFPRADVMHLAFVAALPYVLTAVAMSHLMPARAGGALACVMLVLASVFGANFFNGLRGTLLVPSPVGNLRVASDAVPEVQKWVAEVHPGDSMFVYPYMPLQYFLTQTRNPTQFSFLAPGMMTNREESVALAELQADPPTWLAYLKLPREEFLRVFPNASNLSSSFPALENWLEDNYQPVENPPVTVFGYQLRRRLPRPSALSTKSVKPL